MENFNASDIQRKLFQHIMVRSGEKSAIPMLCELLHLNKSSVYSRIKGEKLLPMDELFLLARATDFHLDQHLFQGTGLVGFQFSFLTAPVRNCREYLEQVLASFQLFSTIPDLRTWFSVSSLSYFQMLNFRELALFKFFAYSRITWQLPYTENLVFSPDSFPEKDVYERLMKPILTLYSRLETIEFWPDALYHTTIKQIHYFVHSGQLKDRALVQLLLEQLQALCEHQYNMAKEGQKWVYGENFNGQGGKFDLYHNEIAPLNITMLAESQYMKGLFNVYDDPNFMFTTDEAMYQYTLASMERLKGKCLHISEGSEQNRRAYFNSIQEDIKKAY